MDRASLTSFQPPLPNFPSPAPPSQGCDCKGLGGGLPIVSRRGLGEQFGNPGWDYYFFAGIPSFPIWGGGVVFFPTPAPNRAWEKKKNANVPSVERWEPRRSKAERGEPQRSILSPPLSLSRLPSASQPARAERKRRVESAAGAPKNRGLPLPTIRRPFPGFTDSALGLDPVVPSAPGRYSQGKAVAEFPGCRKAHTRWGFPRARTRGMERVLARKGGTIFGAGI